MSCEGPNTGCFYRSYWSNEFQKVNLKFCIELNHGAFVESSTVHMSQIYWTIIKDIFPVSSKISSHRTEFLAKRESVESTGFFRIDRCTVEPRNIYKP